MCLCTRVRSLTLSFSISPFLPPSLPPSLPLLPLLFSFLLLSFHPPSLYLLPPLSFLSFPIFDFLVFHPLLPSHLHQSSCLLCPYTSLCLLSLSLSVRESRGWELMFTTPPLERVPHRIALNVRSVAGASGGPTLAVVIGKRRVGVVLGEDYCIEQVAIPALLWGSC